MTASTNAAAVPTGLQSLGLKVPFPYKAGLDIAAISYMDVINDKQTCRDDLWIATTEALNALRAPAALPEAAPVEQDAADELEALRAKCALLSASLKQADVVRDGLVTALQGLLRDAVRHTNEYDVACDALRATGEMP